MPPEECQKQGKCSAKSWQAGNLIGEYDPYRYGNLIYVYVQRMYKEVISVVRVQAPGLLFTSDDETGRAFELEKASNTLCCKFPLSQGMWGTLSAPSAEAEEASSLALFLFPQHLNLFVFVA